MCEDVTIMSKLTILHCHKNIPWSPQYEQCLELYVKHTEMPKHHSLGRNIKISCGVALSIENSFSRPFGVLQIIVVSWCARLLSPTALYDLLFVDLCRIFAPR